MKLYTSGFGSSPARVHMFLNEIGFDLERINVNLSGGENFGPDYKKINPSRKVPTLEFDDGEFLSETTAICRFLDSTENKGESLFGDTPRERANIEMWDRRMELEVMMPMAMTFRHGNPKMAKAEKQVPAYAESLQDGIAKRFARMDRELEGHDFIAGDRFSYADITAYVSFMFFGKLCGFKPSEDQTNLAAWLARIAERPSTQGILYR
jgi:glutathione S-transferase